MTEETVTQQDNLEAAKKYFDGFPEAPYSDSFKWIDTNGFEHLSTARAWSGSALLSSIDKITLAIANKGGVPAGAKIHSAPASSSEPVYQPIDDNGNDKPAVKTFTVDRLSIKSEDGKHFYKVMGGKFSKYGCTVWPEVLEAAGIKIDHATGQINTSVSGWTAEYAEFVKDGNTRTKVVKLSPI